MQGCVSLLTALHARSRQVASEVSGADVSVFPDCVSHQCKVHLRVGVQACVSLLTALHARSRKVASEGSGADVSVFPDGTPCMHRQFPDDLSKRTGRGQCGAVA